MAVTPPEHPTELPLPRPDPDALAALAPDDFILVSQWAPEPDPAAIDDADKIWLWLKRIVSDAGPPLYHGEVCCFPLPEGVQQGELRVVLQGDILAVIPKEELPDARLRGFFSTPGPEHDDDFKRFFREMRDEEREDPTAAEPLESQVGRLADFILSNVPGEPARNEGAIDCAIRIIGTLLALEQLGLAWEVVRRFIDEERGQRPGGSVGRADLGGAYRGERPAIPAEDYFLGDGDIYGEQKADLRLQCVRAAVDHFKGKVGADALEMAQRAYDFVVGLHPITAAEIDRRGLGRDVLGPDPIDRILEAGETVPLYQLSGVALEDIEAVLETIGGAVPPTTQTAINCDRALGYIRAAREERDGRPGSAIRSGAEVEPAPPVGTAADGNATGEPKGGDDGGE